MNYISIILYNMIDFVNIILMLCLIGCLMYIYWMHNTNSFNIKNKLFGINKPNPIRHNNPIVKSIKDDEIDEKIDELSFLKSNSDISQLTKGEIDDFDE